MFLTNFFKTISSSFVFVMACSLSIMPYKTQLVEKVAVPLVAERLSTAYDAMSRSQTACLTTTVSELLVFEPSEAALKTLLGSALEALKVRDTKRFALLFCWGEGGEGVSLPLSFPPSFFYKTPSCSLDLLGGGRGGGFSSPFLSPILFP